jgi:hypothetical protein
MKVGPSKAAQLARVARSTIYKDIEEGKLSAEQDGKGHRVIDVSELERVYGELSAPDNGETSDNVRAGQIRTDEKDKSDSPLQREVDFLRERLAEKDERLHEKDTTIEDLRGERDRLLRSSKSTPERSGCSRINEPRSKSESGEAGGYGVAPRRRVEPWYSN